MNVSKQSAASEVQMITEHQIQLKLTSDGAGYINLNPSKLQSVRNQVIEVTDQPGNHRGTVVLDLTEAGDLLGIELLGARIMLDATFFSD